MCLYSCICLRDEEFLHRLKELSCDGMTLPCNAVNSISELEIQEEPYILSIVDGRVQLAPRDKTMGNPVVVDFSSGAIGFRGRQNVRQELLVKATLGRHKQSQPKVLDMTGGLGRDSFILASAGCKVTTLERNPLVFLLLSDGLFRAAMDVELNAVTQHINLYFGDSKGYLNNDIQHDVVYLDPMFPERAKSALVKKEMRVFRDVVGEDMDVNQLFEQAQEVAHQKVIVKRPRKSAYVMDKKPTYSVEGRSSRFDVYQM